LGRHTTRPRTKKVVGQIALIAAPFRVMGRACPGDPRLLSRCSALMPAQARVRRIKAIVPTAVRS
jgi:hypothetical protein